MYQMRTLTCIDAWTNPVDELHHGPRAHRPVSGRDRSHFWGLSTYAQAHLGTPLVDGHRHRHRDTDTDTETQTQTQTRTQTQTQTHAHMHAYTCTYVLAMLGGDWCVKVHLLHLPCAPLGGTCGRRAEKLEADSSRPASSRSTTRCTRICRVLVGFPDGEAAGRTHCHSSPPHSFCPLHARGL